VIATFIAIFPDLWVNIFTSDASVRAASRQYLSTAAPCTRSSGWRCRCIFPRRARPKVVGPVLAQSARLLFIALGGWWLSMHDATARTFFRLPQRQWWCWACCPPQASS